MPAAFPPSWTRSAAPAHLDALTVTGQTIAENIEGRRELQSRRHPAREKALVQKGGMAVLRGNLAPDGAIIKPSAASPELMQHRGRAVVFEDIDHYKAHRRSRSRHRRQLHHGAEELRPEGLSRHGRGRQHGAARESCCSRASPTWCASPMRA
jgi:hypothetical protein